MGIRVYLSRLLIPLGLIVLWVCLLAAQIFLVEKSFTLLSHNYDREVFRTYDNTGLDVGKKFTAHFTSKENYLGIVSIYFNQQKKMTNGRIVFRIKEENKPNWYYENTYDARQLNDLSLYPFGFPIIDNSKDKKYIVEIELERNSQLNTSLGLSKYGSLLVTHHKFPKEPLLDNNANFASFFIKKVFNILANNYQLFASTIYLYPFLFYLGWKTAKSKFARKSFLGIIVLTTFIDTVFISQFIDLAYVTIALLWLFLLSKTQSTSRYSYGVGLGFLVVGIIAQVLSIGSIVEKSASWAFMCFTIGLILNIKEIRKNA